MFDKLIDVLSYDMVYDLAKMSRNVYYKLPKDTSWLNVSLPQVFDTSIDNDTVRSYLFTNSDRSINVIAFKGTSLPWFSFTTDDIEDQGTFNDDVVRQQGTFNDDVVRQQGTLQMTNPSVRQGTFNDDVVRQQGTLQMTNPSVRQGTFNDDVVRQQGTLQMENNSNCYIPTNDKVNDNLYFSCCFYKHIESCKECMYKDENTCCKACYKSSAKYSYNYMNIADNIVSKIKEYVDFENSLVIFTGHSLGGTLASMMGLTYNKTAVAFESPGDKHYIDLVGLGDTRSDKIYHFGHDADPLFIGNCGMTCSSLGYYVNTKCHVGNTCSFRSKEKLGYGESILKHRIDYIINNIIPHWETDFPECVKVEDCVDCEDWTYI